MLSHVPQAGLQPSCSLFLLFTALLAHLAPTDPDVGAAGIRRAAAEADDDEDDEDEDFEASGGTDSSEDIDEEDDAEMIDEEGEPGEGGWAEAGHLGRVCGVREAGGHGVHRWGRLCDAARLPMLLA